MIKNRIKNIALFILFTAVIIFGVFINNKYIDNSNKYFSEVTPIFYYENYRNKNIITKTMQVDRFGRETLIGPYIRTFSKVIPRSSLLSYGKDEESIMRELGYLLAYFNLEEGKISVFDEYLSINKRRQFCINNNAKTKVNYAEDEYYIKTVPINNDIYLYTYEQKLESNYEYTILNLYIINNFGKINKHEVNLKNIGLKIGNIKSNSIIYLNDKWVFSAFVNGINYLYILNKDGYIKKIKWEGSIINILTDMNNIYILSTTDFNNIITTLSLNGDYLESKYIVNTNRNELILERSTYIHNGKIYYFIVERENVVMRVYDLKSQKSIFKEYELDSEDVLMDVILVDKSMKFDLIPGIERGNK